MKSKEQELRDKGWQIVDGHFHNSNTGDDVWVYPAERIGFAQAWQDLAYYQVCHES